MGILSTLFGGSGNKAYKGLNKTLSPAIEGGVNALNNLSSELAGGFDAFKKKIGFDFQLGQGLRNITGTKAAQGLLNSGSAGRAFVDYGNNLQSGMYDNYLNKLAVPAQLGLGAASTLSGAGQSSKNGIIPGISGFFSDRRLKTDIVRVGQLDNGLPVYAYRMINGGPVQIGLMADEVEQLHPEAVAASQVFFSDGPYKVVDYGKAVL